MPRRPIEQVGQHPQMQIRQILVLCPIEIVLVRARGGLIGRTGRGRGVRQNLRRCAVGEEEDQLGEPVLENFRGVGDELKMATFSGRRRVQEVSPSPMNTAPKVSLPSGARRWTTPDRSVIR